MDKNLRYIKCMNFSKSTKFQLRSISIALMNDYSVQHKSKHDYTVNMYFKNGNPLVDFVVDGKLAETFYMIISKSVLGIDEGLFAVINEKAETLFKEEAFYGVKDAGKLSAIIGSVLGSYSDQEYYPGIVKKATMYWYKIATSQVFHNGNKRTGLLSALFMLNANGFSLRDIDGNQLYEISRLIANKKMSQQELEDFILSQLTLNYYTSKDEALNAEQKIEMKVSVDNPED